MSTPENGDSSLFSKPILGADASGSPKHLHSVAADTAPARDRDGLPASDVIAELSSDIPDDPDPFVHFSEWADGIDETDHADL
jgi:hypothetical protein